MLRRHDNMKQPLFIRVSIPYQQVNKCYKEYIEEQLNKALSFNPLSAGQ